MLLEILYYPHGERGPVADHLADLAQKRPKAFIKITSDLEVLAAEGLRSPRIVIRPLGAGLWELKRLYDGIQYRLFFGVRKNAVWLLHFIEKKSAKAPGRDLRLAFRRYGEVMRNEGI